MGRRNRAVAAIFLKTAVLLVLFSFLPDYLMGQSQGTLSQKAAMLPVILCAATLVVGLLLGLWVRGGEQS